MSPHTFACTVTWMGNRGSGTSGYRDYGRDHLIEAPGKPAILGSSAPAFRGDAGRYNPEEMLVAALSACHMLWYLHLAAEAGVRVTGYRDEARGEMRLNADGSGEFTSVTLRPVVSIAVGGDEQIALRLHEGAHAKCFIARSVNFPVGCEARIETL